MVFEIPHKIWQVQQKFKWILSFYQKYKLSQPVACNFFKIWSRQITPNVHCIILYSYLKEILQ